MHVQNNNFLEGNILNEELFNYISGDLEVFLVLMEEIRTCDKSVHISVENI